MLRCVAGRLCSAAATPPGGNAAAAAAVASTGSAAGAATTGVAPAKGSTGKSPAPNSEAKKPTRVSRPVTPFRPLPIHNWQRLSGTWDTRSESHRPPVVALPEALSFHGPVLGPRPLLVIGGAVDSPSAADARAQSFAPIASQLAWGHGVIHVPIVATRNTASAALLLRDVCNQVAALMDALGINWTHVLGHSLGALVAAKMTYLHPTRIGTLLTLDSQLVEKQWIKNTATRLEIANALKDVNVPASALALRIDLLKEQLEQPLVPSCKGPDQGLYSDVLFEPKTLYGDSEGVTRDDDAYLSIQQLRGIRHPIQLLVPTSNGICDVNTHKDFFNLRRVQPIKLASSHDALFEASGGVAEEIGGIVEQWLHRFEPDTIMARRYESAAKEMGQRMQGAATAGQAATGEKPAADSAAPGGKGGKKEKKKK